MNLEKKLSMLLGEDKGDKVRFLNECVVDKIFKNYKCDIKYFNTDITEIFDNKTIMYGNCIFNNGGSKKCKVEKNVDDSIDTVTAIYNENNTEVYYTDSDGKLSTLMICDNKNPEQKEIYKFKGDYPSKLIIREGSQLKEVYNIFRSNNIIMVKAEYMDSGEEYSYEFTQSDNECILTKIENLTKNITLNLYGKYITKIKDGKQIMEINENDEKEYYYKEKTTESYNAIIQKAEHINVITIKDLKTDNEYYITFYKESYSYSIEDKDSEQIIMVYLPFIKEKNSIMIKEYFDNGIMMGRIKYSYTGTEYQIIEENEFNSEYRIEKYHSYYMKENRHKIFSYKYDSEGSIQEQQFELYTCDDNEHALLISKRNTISLEHSKSENYYMIQKSDKKSNGKTYNSILSNNKLNIFEELNLHELMEF